MVGQVLFLQVTFDDFERVSGLFELACHNARPDFVEPGFLVFGSFHGEGSATELFSKNSIFEFDGAVLVFDKVRDYVWG